MGTKKHQRNPELWRVVRGQHGVVARSQLRELGLGSRAIQRRIEAGRLHPIWRGVYAVGRPEVSEQGRWMAAVLSCGPGALLSHGTAAILWGMWKHASGIDVVVPYGKTRRRPGIRVHRRLDLANEDRCQVAGIPVTDPVSTLVDLATCSSEARLERAINEADRLDLVDPESLRTGLDPLPRRPGLARLRNLLDRQTFTDSKLEVRFLELVRGMGLPVPDTQAWVNGFRVDFFWRNLGLVVETDGLRYHRTPAQQAKDQHRDQAHTAAGLTTLRFPGAQVRYEPNKVAATLKAVISRLQNEK